MPVAETHWERALANLPSSLWGFLIAYEQLSSEHVGRVQTVFGWWLMDFYEDPSSSPHQSGYDYLSLIDAGQERGTVIKHLLYARSCTKELHVFSLV